jgi:hypothetical protein
MLHYAVGLALLLVAPAARPQGQDSRFAIAGLEAKLFYSNSGRFSANILGNPKIVLHNTPIGEGTVEGPSEKHTLGRENPRAAKGSIWKGCNSA